MLKRTGDSHPLTPRERLPVLFWIDASRTARPMGRSECSGRAVVNWSSRPCSGGFIFKTLGISR